MRTILVLTILAGIAAEAYAVDGVILLNQSAALAGNSSIGDSPGFPITITVGGSYRLSSDLTVPDANAIAISIDAEGVTIDLNGFSIIGPTFCNTPPTRCTGGSGNGILAIGERLTIRNGSIRGMGASGIQVLLGRSRIEKVHVSQNGSSGIVSEGGVVSDCVATFNDGNGIAWVGPGTGKGSVFSGNSATGNGGFGISAACPSLITGNSAFGNPGGNIFSAGAGCIATNKRCSLNLELCHSLLRDTGGKI